MNNVVLYIIEREITLHKLSVLLPETIKANPTVNFKSPSHLKALALRFRGQNNRGGKAENEHDKIHFNFSTTE